MNFYELCKHTNSQTRHMKAMTHSSEELPRMAECSRTTEANATFVENKGAMGHLSNNPCWKPRHPFSGVSSSVCPSRLIFTKAHSGATPNHVHSGCWGSFGEQRGGSWQPPWQIACHVATGCPVLYIQICRGILAGRFAEQERSSWLMTHPAPSLFVS